MHIVQISRSVSLLNIQPFLCLFNPPVEYIRQVVSGSIPRLGIPAFQRCALPVGFRALNRYLPLGKSLATSRPSRTRKPCCALGLSLCMSASRSRCSVTAVISARSYVFNQPDGVGRRAHQENKALGRFPYRSNKILFAGCWHHNQRC